MFLKSKNRRLSHVKSLAVALVFLARFNGVANVAAAEVGAPSGEIFWKSHVLPILREHCWNCHGSVKQKGGLDLRTLESALHGGDSGEVVDPTSPGGSLLIQMIQPDAETRMPPKGDPLDAEQIAILTAWVSKLDSENLGDAESNSDSDSWHGREAQFAGGDGSIANTATGKSVLLSLPLGLAPRRAIDWIVESAWRSEGRLQLDADWSPSLASDAEFVRRVYLDLIGRIPTRSETSDFLLETRSEKRELLVDGLLESKEHSDWMAVIFDWVFLGRGGPHGERDRRREQGWMDYLEWAFEENRAWDQMVRDLIVARTEDPKAKGSTWFLYGFKNQPQVAAERIAPALFGKQIQCAQCHDHPIAPEIRQDHYWGLVAFLKRSSNVIGPNGPALAERATGGFEQFNTLQGEARDALPIFIGQKVSFTEKPTDENPQIEAPELYLEKPEPAIDAQFDKKAPQVQVVATPINSWREELAKQAIDEDPEFGRALVNRVWAYLLGRGWIHPVDKMDSAHPATHPEALDWLTLDFQRSGYDIRRLMREIVLSRTYQLEAWDAQGHDGEIAKPLQETFSYALIKPLPAEAIARSCLVALSGLPPSNWDQLSGTSLEPRFLEQAFVERFPDLFEETPGTTIHQALFLTNNPRFNGIVQEANAGLLAELDQIESDEKAVQLAFETIFGRPADAEELERSVNYLSGATAGVEGKDLGDSTRKKRYSNFVWALLTSSEFRLNH